MKHQGSREPLQTSTVKVYDTNPQGAATCEPIMSRDRKNNYIMQIANLLIIAVAALILIGIGVAIFMAGIVSASQVAVESVCYRVRLVGVSRSLSVWTP